MLALGFSFSSLADISSKAFEEIMEGVMELFSTRGIAAPRTSPGTPRDPRSSEAALTASLLSWARIPEHRGSKRGSRLANTSLTGMTPGFLEAIRSRAASIEARGSTKPLAALLAKSIDRLGLRPCISSIKAVARTA